MSVPEAGDRKLCTGSEPPTCLVGQRLLGVVQTRLEVRVEVGNLEERLGCRSLVLAGFPLLFQLPTMASNGSVKLEADTKTRTNLKIQGSRVRVMAC